MDKQGIKGLPPLSPAPQIPAQGSSAALRTSHFRHPRLTMANTSGTIIPPASLRSDCCSPSFRNTVRLPSGIGVRLHRNTHTTNAGEFRKLGSFNPPPEFEIPP